MGRHVRRQTPNNIGLPAKHPSTNNVVAKGHRTRKVDGNKANKAKTRGRDKNCSAESPGPAWVSSDKQRHPMPQFRSSHYPCQSGSNVRTIPAALPSPDKRSSWAASKARRPSSTHDIAHLSRQISPAIGPAVPMETWRAVCARAIWCAPNIKCDKPRWQATQSQG